MWLSEDIQFVRDRSICYIRFHEINREVSLFTNLKYSRDRDSPYRLMMELGEVDPGHADPPRPYKLVRIYYDELPFGTEDAPEDGFDGRTLSKWLRGNIGGVMDLIREEFDLDVGLPQIHK
jgi:hypothetical protein